MGPTYWGHELDLTTLQGHIMSSWSINRFRDIRPQNPCARTHRQKEGKTILSHAMYCIGQTIR